MSEGVTVRAAIATAALLCGLAAAQGQVDGPANSPPATPLAVPRTEADVGVRRRINEATFDTRGADNGVDPAVLKAEVLLARAHVSPGVIDGRSGGNFEHALQAFAAMHGLEVRSGLDKTIWDALLAAGGDRPVLVDHVLTAEDVAGPFFPDLPKDYAKLAALPTIGYRNVAQKLGAKFHMGEDLLGALNPGVDLGAVGAHILVADAGAPAVEGRLARIVVDKRKSEVIALDAGGAALVVLPATIGSRELPSPSGTYKVKGVAWNPIYYYDPKNFVQGDNKTKLRLPPGPNNPVGSVFIALTKPTYGLHGTPDPSAIDKTASHGCVRMTNWDAAMLAHLVRPGVVVRFARSFDLIDHRHHRRR